MTQDTEVKYVPRGRNTGHIVYADSNQAVCGANVHITDAYTSMSLDEADLHGPNFSGECGNCYNVAEKHGWLDNE